MMSTPSLAAILLLLIACTPARVVVEAPPVTIVVASPDPVSRCEDLERVLVEDEIRTIAATDAGSTKEAEEE